VGEDGGVEIAVRGSLDPQASGFDPRPLEIVRGLVRGQPVTLEQVWLTKTQGIDPADRIEHFHVGKAWEGRHLSAPSSKKIVGLSIGYTQLSGFHQLRGFEMLDDGGYRSAPVSRQANLPAAELYFQTSARTSLSWDRVELASQHSVWVQLATPMTEDEAFSRVTFPLQHLLTLASFGPVEVREVSVQLVGADTMPLLVRYHRAESIRPDRSGWEFLFTAESWDLQSGLEAWWRLWAVAEVALVTLTSTLKDGSYTAVDLLSAASAAEALHAALNPDKDVPTTIQSERLARILGDIGKSKDRSWAKGLLKNGHKLSLQRRLEDMLAAMEQRTTSALTGDPSKWAQHVSEVRNAITHSDPRAREYLADGQLIYTLTVTLRAICVLYVMSRLNFDQDGLFQASRRAPLSQSLGMYNLLQHHVSP
jgi:hypothetical protein